MFLYKANEICLMKLSFPIANHLSEEKLFTQMSSLLPAYTAKLYLVVRVNNKMTFGQQLHPVLDPTTEERFEKELQYKKVSEKIKITFMKNNSDYKYNF